MTPANSFDRFCLRLGRAAVLVLVIATAFLLTEFAARILHRPEPLRRVYDPFAYRIPQPNLVDSFEAPDGAHVTVRLNDAGMRGPALSQTSGDTQLTLVFLGGSTTENYSLPRHQTFPELIGEQLRQSSGRPVRVFNAGMSSATTSTSLGRLQHQVLDLDPSLIVLMHAINDLLFGFLPHFRTDGRHLPRPAEIGRLPRSYLLDWIRLRRLDRTSAAASRTTAVGPRFQQIDYRNFSALQVFERNLHSIAAITSSRNIPTLFLTQATRYRHDPAPDDEHRFRIASRVLGRHTDTPDIPSLARGMDAFNSAVLALASVPGIKVFDLAAQLPADQNTMWDECHLTHMGNQLVAELVGPIVTHLVLSDSSESADGNQALPEP